MKLPNILITGTPGTGKTQTSGLLAEKYGLNHLNVGDFARENQCYESYDEEFDTHIVDEEKLIDLLTPIIEAGGNVVDYHSGEFLPEDWFDLILVLQTTTENIYDRLVERGYNDKKVNENLECEIMQVVLEEIRECYDASIIQVLPSNTIEDMESNIERFGQWYELWKENNK